MYLSFNTHILLSTRIKFYSLLLFTRLWLTVGTHPQGWNDQHKIIWLKHLKLAIIEEKLAHPKYKDPSLIEAKELLKMDNFIESNPIPIWFGIIYQFFSNLFEKNVPLPAGKKSPNGIIFAFSLRCHHDSIRNEQPQSIIVHYFPQKSRTFLPWMSS